MHNDLILNKRTKILHQRGCGFIPLILNDNYQEIKTDGDFEKLRKLNPKCCTRCFGGY